MGLMVRCMVAWITFGNRDGVENMVEVNLDQREWSLLPPPGPGRSAARVEGEDDEVYIQDQGEVKKRFLWVMKFEI